MGRFIATVGLVVAVTAGYFTAYQAGYKKGQWDWRGCAHERVVNYDLERAKVDLMGLRKEIDWTRDALARAEEFLKAADEKFGKRL